MSAPLVFLVLRDALAPLDQALRESLPAVRFERVPPEDLGDRCASARVDLIVVDADVDDSAGTAAIRALGTHGEAPRAMIVFADPADIRRPMALRMGCFEHITGDRDARAQRPRDSVELLLDAAPQSSTSTWEIPAPPSSGSAQPLWLPALLAKIEHLLEVEARDLRKAAQAQQFSALVEASSDGIYVLRGGVFSWANRRFQEMVGYTLEELTDPDFSMLDRITAQESRALIEARARRVDAGQAVEPRYEFVAKRKNGERFDAQVSVAYLEAQEAGGAPGALGIMQDITERKSFEQLLLQRNRELQQLNQLTATIGEAETLDDVLHLGCQHIIDALGAGAAGISLLTTDGAHLQLRAAAGLSDTIARALDVVTVRTSTTLLAEVARTATVAVVDNAAVDERIAVKELRSMGGGVIVTPLMNTNGERAEVAGVAFCFLPPGTRPTETSRDLLIAIANKLANAVDKALLLDAEKAANRKLVALDEIALALASTLDVDEVALTVARSAHRLFGAMRVMIATFDKEAGFFVPSHVLDDGEPVPAVVPISVDDTIMQLALQERRPVQRVRSLDDDAVAIDPFLNRTVPILPHEGALFRQGVGTAVAVPIMLDGEEMGALWLGYTATSPLSEADLQVLSAIGTHVAIANKNARLFEERESALKELRDAQSKLVDAEKLNAIGLIAHGVAHDFNNILGSILGRAQLLRSQLRDAAHLKHVDIIERAAQDGAETVRRIQEIGRQDRVDDFVAVDAAAILNDVIELTRPRHTAGRVPVTVTVDIDPGAEAGPQGLRVAGNPAELREVLINLVHNAIDAMQDGRDNSGDAGASAQVTLRAQLADHRIIIDVEDNGAGIPADVLPKIFDPYFTTKGERGTGLGLSVSQSIIRRHGGLLSARSQTEGPARGTTFTLDLPMFEDFGAAAVAAATATEGAPGRARVLVVDDEENIREILAEMLMTNDHEVITANDGAEALHKLQGDDAIDLMFTDLGLPGMSGYEVAQEAKRLRPDLLVGLITGWGATIDQDKARENGVDLVISKPFRFDEVLGVVDEALLSRGRGRL